jgi:hypothetical protein
MAYIQVMIFSRDEVSAIMAGVGTANECAISTKKTLLPSMDSCMPNTRLPAGTGSTSSSQNDL